MKCPNCGKEVTEGKKFCGFCGQKLPVESSVVIPPSPKREVVHEDIPKTSPASTPAPKSVETGKQVPPSTRLLFEDDFSSKNTTWEFQKPDMSERNITNGVMTWENTEESFLAINLLNIIDPIADSYTEVTVDYSGMADDAWVDLRCRQNQSNNHAYAAEFIKTDGHVSIYKLDGEWIKLAESNLGNSLGQVKIRFDCIGSELTAFVDGKKVVSTQDDDFTSGKIGLGLGNIFKSPNIAVFDDFRLYVP